jgi:uncharacterized membrane-anchored protein
LLVFALVFSFGIWKWYSKTDTIEGGLSKTTEFLYWLAILTSSTLGNLIWRFIGTRHAFLFCRRNITFIKPADGCCFTGVFYYSSKRTLYWLAIILTHPIGATMGDYLTKPEGMNLGNIKASLVLILVFIVVIATGKLVLKKQPK